MAPKNNGDVAEAELSRLADHFCIDHLDQVCIQFLGLTKDDVARCRYNALRNSGTDDHAWMTIFYCLCTWRKTNKDANQREILYNQLYRASEKGLISKSDIAFLKDVVRKVTD